MTTLSLELTYLETRVMSTILKFQKLPLNTPNHLANVDNPAKCSD